MNIIEFSSPAPSCLIPLTHPARAVVSSINTDVGRTIAEHDLSILDSYELTDRLGHLEQAGEFRG
ncbi:MAG TPA: hypothetical protein PKD87_17070 [Burkholderiaceae bacterium]|nr:hypothetical protein [Burkholderiaceae bacterium]